MTPKRLITLPEAAARLGIREKVGRPQRLRQRVLREIRRREKRDGRAYLVKGPFRNSPCFVDADALDTVAPSASILQTVEHLTKIVRFMLQREGLTWEDVHDALRESG